MEIVAWVVVIIAWCIPGSSHRWARTLRAERKAARYYTNLLKR